MIRTGAPLGCTVLSVLLVCACHPERSNSPDPAVAVQSDSTGSRGTSTAEFRARVRALLASTRRDLLTTEVPGRSVTVYAIISGAGAPEATVVQLNRLPEGPPRVGIIFPGEVPDNFASAGVGVVAAGDIGPNQITLAWWARPATESAQALGNGSSSNDAAWTSPPAGVPTQAALRAALDETYPQLRAGAAPRGQTVWFVADTVGNVLAHGISPEYASSTDVRMQLGPRFPSLAIRSVYMTVEMLAADGRSIPVAWVTTASRR